MHTMKLLTPCLLLLTAHAQAQSNTGRPFYDFMTDHYALNPVVDSVQRSGLEKMYDRAMKVWAPRLWPHGDFSKAAEAMWDHATNYATRTAFCPPAEVEWEEMGKAGQPLGNSGAQGTGQIHRITFDPGYDGVDNTTIYAATAFGGLWRTDDDGDSWHVVNTDDLPLASASDVAISHQNTDHIFMSTGYADGGLAWDFGPNGEGINPFNTIGIYRSTDRGGHGNLSTAGPFRSSSPIRSRDG